MQADRDDFEARRAERAARREQRSGAGRGAGRGSGAGRRGGAAGSAGGGYAGTGRSAARRSSSAGSSPASSLGSPLGSSSRPSLGRPSPARAMSGRAAQPTRTASTRGGMRDGYDRGGTASGAGSAASAVLDLLWRAVRALFRGLAMLLALLWRGLCALVRVLVPACRKHPRAALSVAAVLSVAVVAANVHAGAARSRQEVYEAATLAGAQQQAQAIAGAVGTRAANLVEPASTPKDQWKRGEMPYLYQIDPQWSYETYSGGRLRHQGCGPTALTMVYVYLTGNTDYDPAKMCEFSTKQGYSTDQNGTSWSLMTDGAATLGLESTQIGVSESRVKAELEAGHPVICIMNPGHFTSSGHFIAIEKLDESGKAVVHDSNSWARSQKTWDLSVICSEAASAWSFSVE